MANYIKYTYQFRPIRHRDGELNFCVSEEEADMAMAKKQAILSEILNRDSIPIKKKNCYFDNRICYKRGDKFIIHVASNHVFRRAKDFVKREIAHNPWNTIIIDNRKDVQVMYMENVSDSFKNPSVLSDMLELSLNMLLYSYNLQLSIKPVFYTDEFWDFIQKHKNLVSWVEFTFSYPNLPKISVSNPYSINMICKATNSSSNIRFFADADPNIIISKGLNEYLDSMVEAASEAGNTIKVKVVGVRTPFDIGCEKYKMVLFPNDISERACANTLFDDDSLDSLSILLNTHLYD